MLEKSKVEEQKHRKSSLDEIIKKKDYKALSQTLEEGISDYLNGETFQNYLNFISQFHQYSQRNVRLLLAQNPNISYVAGFQKWKKLDRWVNKGEKALYVYAPMIIEEKDKDGHKVADENGEIKKEVRFFLTPVFDVSQTSGEPLPKQINVIEDDLDSPQMFPKIYHAIESLSPVPVSIEPFPKNNKADGYYHLKNKEIKIKQGLGEVLTLKVLIHEITHALLHADSSASFGNDAYSRQEFEAESVAYVVSQHLGLDTSEYSFGYLASWTDRGNELKNLTDSLEVITQKAKELIEDIDHTLEKVYTLDAPKNKFEERVALARNPLAETVRSPKQIIDKEGRTVKTVEQSIQKRLSNNT